MVGNRMFASFELNFDKTHSIEIPYILLLFENKILTLLEKPFLNLNECYAILRVVIPQEILLRGPQLFSRVNFIKLKCHFWHFKHHFWHLECQNMGIINASFGILRSIDSKIK